MFVPGRGGRIPGMTRSTFYILKYLIYGTGCSGMRDRILSLKSRLGKGGVYFYFPVIEHMEMSKY
jgi:hypothetical protein